MTELASAIMCYLTTADIAFKLTYDSDYTCVFVCYFYLILKGILSIYKYWHTKIMAFLYSLFDKSSQIRSNKMSDRISLCSCQKTKDRGHYRDTAWLEEKVIKVARCGIKSSEKT